MAQGGPRAPKKEYKPGEFELYDAAAKAVAAQNFHESAHGSRGVEAEGAGFGLRE